MKKTLLLITLLIALVGGLVAQEPAPTPTRNQPTAEELKQAKETLRALVSDDTSTTATPQQGKTVADVLDKGIDVFSGYVTTLEGVVSKYAPEVWRIMVKQQYAKAIANPLFWGLLLLVPLAVNYFGRKSLGATKGQTLWDADTHSEGFLYFLFGVAPAIASVVFGAIFAYSLTEGIMIAINPEYYALKDIIQMLR